MRSPLESIAWCVAALLVTSAGCASAEVDRLIKATEATIAKARPRFEAPVLERSDGTDGPGGGADEEADLPALARPSHAAAYQYWTAVAYLGETRRLRARAEFGQALGLVRVAQKAVAEALRLLEAP